LNMRISTWAIALLAMSISTAVFADPDGKSGEDSFPALKDAVVLVIRHAEKPASGDGLTPAGEERAAAYVNYFKNLTLDGQPVKLDCLIAAADSPKSRRSRLTIEPTGKALGLAIDHRFGDKEFNGLVKEMASKPRGQAILIAWHHGEIPGLIQALGADPDKLLPKAKWPDDVFGWMIELRYDSNGGLMEAKRINEKLMPDDTK